MENSAYTYIAARTMVNGRMTVWRHRWVAAVVMLLCMFNANYAQTETDWQRWGAAQPEYRMKTVPAADDPDKSGGRGLFGLLRGAYRIFISDLDGDNCPFSPSCSAFFVSSVTEAGLIKGMLMFSDRFTRDVNLIKFGLYPVASNGRFYDPPENYILPFRHNHPRQEER